MLSNEAGPRRDTPSPLEKVLDRAVEQRAVSQALARPPSVVRETALVPSGAVAPAALATVTTWSAPARLRWRGVEVSEELQRYAERVAAGEELAPYRGPILASPRALFPWRLEAPALREPRRAGARSHARWPAWAKLLAGGAAALLLVGLRVAEPTPERPAPQRPASAETTRSGPTRAVTRPLESSAGLTWTHDAASREGVSGAALEPLAPAPSPRDRPPSMPRARTKAPPQLLTGGNGAEAARTAPEQPSTASTPDLASVAADGTENAPAPMATHSPGAAPASDEVPSAAPPIPSALLVEIPSF